MTTKYLMQDSTPNCHAAFHNLPPELLCQIFELCLVGSTSPPSTPFNNPYPLSSVCTSWRNVTFSNPRLWSTLHINWGDIEDDSEMTVHWLHRHDKRGHYGLYSHKSPKPNDRDMPLGFGEGIKQWLHRAGDAITLNLTFDLTRMFIGNEPRKVLEETYRAPIKKLNITGRYTHISELSNSGSAISFKNPADADNSPFLWLSLPVIGRQSSKDDITSDDQQPKANCVEDLTLTLSHVGYFPTVPTIDLSSFTALKRLRILQHKPVPFGVRFFTDELVMGIPYGQLTELHINETHLPQETVRDILKKCPNLERCVFEHIKRSLNSPDSKFYQEPKILLPNMQLIKLTFLESGDSPGANDFNDFFKGLRTPRLIALGLFRIENGLATDVMNDVMNMLSGSERTLLKFYLYKFDEKQNEVREMFPMGVVDIMVF